METNLITLYIIVALTTWPLFGIIHSNATYTQPTPLRLAISAIHGLVVAFLWPLGLTLLGIGIWRGVRVASNSHKTP